MSLVFADDGPERKVERLVDFVIESFECEGDRLRGGLLSETANGPKADLRVLVVNGLRDDLGR